jgi:hypothetical protein
VRDVALAVLVGLTSLAAYRLGARRLGLARAGLGGAVRATLEAVGLGVLFLAANLTLAALAIAAARALTGRFVPVYAIDDLAFVAVSLLQGVLFRWWWRRGRARDAGRTPRSGEPLRGRGRDHGRLRPPSGFAGGAGSTLIHREEDQ